MKAVALGMLRAAGVGASWWRVLAATGWSAGTHAFLDRRRWPVRRILELTGSPGFACGKFTAGARDAEQPVPLHGPYLADQLHHACLAVAAAILAGGESR